MTAIIIGTGPSLSLDQIETASKIGPLYGMNQVWELTNLDHFLACNPDYYSYYWGKGLKDHPSRKWTWDKPTAERFGLNYIEGRWADGFSKDPNYIHYGHCSGFQLPQIAVHQGKTRLLLLGYDMKFPEGYDAGRKNPGGKRHYFGEYPSELQHWPSTRIENGVFVGLIEQFEKVSVLNPEIEIINCTPGSAMTCFEMADIRDFL